MAYHGGRNVWFVDSQGLRLLVYYKSNQLPMTIDWASGRACMQNNRLYGRIAVVFIWLVVLIVDS